MDGSGEPHQGSVGLLLAHLSTFGSRYHPIKKKMRHHSGVDYAAKQGTAVMAAGEGKVVSTG